MSAEAKKIVKKSRIRVVLYLLYAFGMMVLFLNNPADVYTYDWPWLEYNIYNIISFIAFITVQIIGSLVYHYFETRFARIVNEKCDPFLYAECLEAMKVKHLAKNAYHYNMAVVYLHQGEYDAAWKRLMNIKQSRLRGLFRENYYLLKCELLYEYKMIDQMKQVEDEFRAIIRNEKDQQIYKKLCAQNNMYRAYLNKDYEFAYRFLKEHFKYLGPAICMLQKNHFAYWKGVLDMETGNRISAKEEFRFVAENGNRLRCTERAKQMLAELEEPAEESENKEEA